jgi:hypothetical protein
MPLQSNMALSDIIIYLQADLDVSIQNDVYPVIQAEKRDGGYFAVPRLVMCYVDFIGALYSGFSAGTNPNNIATTAKAVKYIDEVMSLVDPLYRQNGKLLVEIYRHGTVHLYSPISLKRNSDNRILQWEVYKGTRREMLIAGTVAAKWVTHMDIYHYDANNDVLPISINCLYEDLRQSIDEYCNLLQHEHASGLTTLKDNFVSAANQIVASKVVNFNW